MDLAAFVEIKVDERLGAGDAQVGVADPHDRHRLCTAEPQRVLLVEAVARPLRGGGDGGAVGGAGRVRRVGMATACAHVRHARHRKLEDARGEVEGAVELTTAAVSVMNCS